MGTGWLSLGWWWTHCHDCAGHYFVGVISKHFFPIHAPLIFTCVSGLLALRGNEWAQWLAGLGASWLGYAIIRDVLFSGAIDGFDPWLSLVFLGCGNSSVLCRYPYVKGLFKPQGPSLGMTMMASLLIWFGGVFTVDMSGDSSEEMAMSDSMFDDYTAVAYLDLINEPGVMPAAEFLDTYDDVPDREATITLVERLDELGSAVHVVPQAEPDEDLIAELIVHLPNTRQAIGNDNGYR